MLCRDIKVPWNAVYLHCDHANDLCIFICPLNHEALTDKLPHLLFGPVRGGAGSGVEQWGLCVRCPQDSKHYSSVPVSKTWSYKVCIKHSLKQISPVCWCEFVSGPPAPRWYKLDPSNVCTCPSVCACMCTRVSVCGRPVCHTRAPVTQGHSCETPLIPVLTALWVGEGGSPSTAQ